MSQPISFNEPSPPAIQTTPGPPVDSTRFLGAGLSFKGKLIGVEDVPQSRGEKMCMVSMAKIKAVVLAIKEHKRPINVGISLEGIKISDEKTEEIIHTHAVSRISFIFRDTTDARAFGYVYSREDGVHQFFGVKTDRAAEAVITSLRDLFEVVYHRNKKVAEADTKTGTVAEEAKADTMVEIRLDDAKDSVGTNPETKVAPPSDQLLNFGSINQPASASTPSNAWLIETFGQDASQANVHGGLKPPQQSLFSPPIGQMSATNQQQTSQQQFSSQQQQVGWQQQQQSFNSFTVRAGAPAAGFNSPSTAAWSSPGTVSVVPQGVQGQGQSNGWPAFDSSLHSDPFQHNAFLTSSTPAGTMPAGAVNRNIPNNNSLSGTFDSSTSVRSSTNQMWGGVFGEVSSASGSGPLGASATINEGFADPTMSLLQPMSAVKIQQGPPPKVDPFADFGLLNVASSSQGSLSKKASKEDFSKEGPKQTLFDLSQSQNPPQSNSFGNIATDDPFA